MAEKHEPIFLSYAPTDQRLAALLAERLRENGSEVLSMPSKKITPQMKFVPGLEKAIGRSKYMVLLISPNYLSSRESNFEAGVATGEMLNFPEKQVIPVLLPGVKRSDVPALMRPSRALDARRMSVPGLATRLEKIIHTFQAPARSAVVPSAKRKEVGKKVGF